MVYDKNLANRIRMILRKCRGVTEKEMFGGISFLIKGKMCCGVIKKDLVLRVDPRDYEILLNRANFRPMDFTGRPLKGFVYVNQAGYKSAASLDKLVNFSLDYVTSLKENKN